MSNEPATVGRLDLLSTGEVLVHLPGQPSFKLNNLQAIDVCEAVKDQARRIQRQRDREKLRAARIENVSYRATIGILQSED